MEPYEMKLWNGLNDSQVGDLTQKERITMPPYLSHPKSNFFDSGSAFFVSGSLIRFPDHWFVFRINFQARFAINFRELVNQSDARSRVKGSSILAWCVFSSADRLPYVFSRMTEVGVYHEIRIPRTIFWSPEHEVLPHKASTYIVKSQSTRLMLELWLPLIQP